MRPALASAPAAIFVAAATLRLLYVLSIRDAYFFQHLQTEPLRYHRWATLILDSRQPPAPPFDEPPGYPYLVAGIYRTLGRSITAVAVVQVLLDALTCALTAVIGRRWFGARVGLLAGALAAAYGPLIYFTGTVEPATAFVCAVTLAITGATAGWWLASGCLWGLALLLRAEVVLALPLAFLDAWRRRRGVARVAAPLALLVVVLASVNVAHTGKLVLFVTGGGLNLWAGNNPDADGVNPFFSGPRAIVAREVVAEAADPSDADAIFARRAIAFWRATPARAAALAWKKVLWTLGDRELPNTGDIEWQTAHSWLFRWPLFPLRFGFVLPLAVVGALRLGRRWRELPLLAAPIAVALGTTVVFFTNARLRLVMVPSLLLLAAAAVDDVVRTTRARRWSGREVAIVAGGLGAGIVLAFGGFYGLRSYRVPEITVNTGILERQAGHLPAAVRLLREGLRDTPRDALAWTHLALALEETGDASGSLQSYLDGLALRPDDPALRANAMAFCRRHGLDPREVDRYLAASTVEERGAVADRMRVTIGPR